MKQGNMKVYHLKEVIVLGIKKPCAEPMCSNLIPFKQKPPYCEKHRRDAYKRQDIRRDPKTKAFYKSADWKKFRESVLAEHNYMCYLCRTLSGKYVHATTVHHIKPITTLEGWENRLLREGTYPLCNTCHNKVHTEKGGVH